jgi:hypothetical protein
MICASCSTTGKPAPEPEIQVVVKTERAVPPEGLVRQCTAAQFIDIVTTRDLVNDRNAWKKAFCSCAAGKDRLIQWNTDKEPPVLSACRD